MGDTDDSSALSFFPTKQMYEMRRGQSGSLLCQDLPKVLSKDR